MEDVTNSDISPVPVSNSVDDRSGKPDETQANKTPKPIKKRPRQHGETRCVQTILRFRNGCKNSERTWWMMKFRYREALTPVHLMELL